MRQKSANGAPTFASHNNDPPSIFRMNKNFRDVLLAIALACGACGLALAAAGAGAIATVLYVALTGDGLFIASLRFILITIAFGVLSQSIGVAVAIGGVLAGMWALALAGLYFALAQLVGLNRLENGLPEKYA